MLNSGTPVWVGIDVGTQGVRAIAVDDHGMVLGGGAAPLHSRRWAGRHEQDAEDWWAAVGTAARAATAEVAAAGQLPAVRAVAVCATSGTVVLTDRDLRPRAAALMYDDDRAVSEAHTVVDSVPAHVWRRTGARPQPSWAFPRIAWLAHTISDRATSARVAHQSDFVTGRLNGAPVPVDTSHALKSGVDPAAATWPAEVTAAIGMPDHALPDLVAPGTAIGSVCPAAAAHTGIPEGTTIIAGMTDGCASQLAAGALAPGTWNSVLGTTLVLKGAARERISDPESGVYSHYSPDGHWWPGGASSTGAGVLRTAFPEANLPAMDAAATLDAPAGALVYPLSGRGERFPFTAPDATGFTLGQPRDEADRYAATLQGVAYLERLCLDRLDALGAVVRGPLRVTGGAVASRAWTQLRADVLGRRLELPAATESAYGMAVLARAAATDTPLSGAAERMVRVRETVEPRPEVTERLREPYQRLVAELGARGWLPDRLNGVVHR